MEHKTCVIVADCGATFRKFMKRITAEVMSDVEAVFCEDGMEVIEFFEDGRNALPCLVLLDLGQASFDVLKWLREQRRLYDLPVIIWTGTPVRSEQDRAEQYGATDYLKKPDTFGELLPVVRNFYEEFCQ